MWWLPLACTEPGGRGAQSEPTGGPTSTDPGPTPPDGASLCPPVPRPSTDCALAEVRCVGTEHATLADALQGAGPGDTVVVPAGTYDGVEITTSGAPDRPLSLLADGEVFLRPGPTGDGIRLTDVSYVRIDGFTIEGPPERCIAARDATPNRPMVGLQILDNTCVDAGVEGFYLSEVSGSLVQGNHIRGSGASGDDRSHGIYLANAGSDDTTLACNDLSGAGPPESNGVHVNGDLSVGGDGLITGLRAIGNVVYDNAQNGFNLDGAQAATFLGNVVYGNGRHAIRAYAIDGADGPRGLTLVANTLVAPSGAAFKTSEDGGGHAVYDNVLVSLNDEEGAIVIEDGSGLQSDGNVLYGGLSAGAVHGAFADWQAAGFDPGSVVAPPDQVFVADDDLHLSPASPAIDRGVPHADAPSVDLDGVARPTGPAIDAGAYEAP